MPNLPTKLTFQLKEIGETFARATRRQPLVLPAILLALGIYLGHKLSPPPWLALSLLVAAITVSLILRSDRLIRRSRSDRDRRLPATPAILVGVLLCGEERR